MKAVCIVVLLSALLKVIRRIRSKSTMWANLLRIDLLY